MPKNACNHRLCLKNAYLSHYFSVRRENRCLINFDNVQKIIVDGKDLEECISRFEQIPKDNLIPVKNDSRIDARLYYVFETEEDGKILDVATWGDDYSVFINGSEFEWYDVYFDAITPFLPEAAVNAFEVYLGN